MRKTAIRFSLIAAVVLAACAPLSKLPQPDVKIAPAPDPKPGSWWVIRQLDGRWVDRLELMAVENEEFFVSINGRESRYTNGWNRLQNVGDQRTIRDSYSPHNRFLSFPLWPGKEWGGIVEWTGRRDTMSGGTFSVWGKAKLWESITVKAGTFEAIRFEVQTGRRLVICWYAPALQRIARCISPVHANSNWETIAFYLAK